MSSAAALPAEVLQALARGWTVLTANQRAARTLRHAFDALQQAEGRATWQPPAIFAWETWLNLLWQRLLLEGNASALLLNAQQEHVLWREIIRADLESADAATLRPVDSLAELAATAARLLHAYQARRRLAAFADTSDTRAFERWAANFDRLCARANYLPQSRLIETLTQLTANKALSNIASSLLLVGFDTKTSAQIAFLEALRNVGVATEDLALAPASASQILVTAASEHDELTICARWLRAHLSASPTSRIAVIVPSLESCRNNIDRVFRQVLAPELNDIAAPVHAGPFEFSLGAPLTASPMVSAALDILRWTIAPLPLDRITALLLSPYFAAEDTNAQPEYIARAEFDAFVLRRQSLLEPELSIASLLGVASRSTDMLPVLVRHLRGLRAHIERTPLAAERSHADWGAFFMSILEAAGWSPASPTSIEFQTRHRWEAALDELASLDFEGHRVSFDTALASLRRIVSQALFAPESREAPIQIMGPLEAAGSRFDTVWFLRAGDLTWPVVSSPNPLLPFGLQRDLAIPGANQAQDSDLARRITERIAASAPVALFSYASETSEGHQRRSPALAGLALEPQTSAELVPPEPAFAPVLIETLADAESIPHPPDRVLRGGAAILQAQAQCGFRAFAEKRLGSSALESPDLGLDPRERGTLVHAALENFWTGVETHAALRLLTAEERAETLAAAVDEALAQLSSHTSPGWSRAYLLTERQRLLHLLGKWLEEVELAREPFAVRLVERSLEDVRIGPLRIDIRVDRIDTHLRDGQPAGEVLLDYKTGAVKPADWLTDRPDEPQLPLYAIVSRDAAASAPQPLAGIAFANIRPGTMMSLQGYQAATGVIPKSAKLKTESLDAQVDAWREVLTQLAKQFYNGNASVEPKKYPTTCRYCEQRLLCRLNPASLLPELLEDLDDPDTRDPEAEFA